MYQLCLTINSRNSVVPVFYYFELFEELEVINTDPEVFIWAQQNV